MRKLILTALLLISPMAAADSPIILDPSVTATPPGVSVTAAYFTIINEGKETITITDAYSPTISRVEIHESIMVDDVASMVKQKSVSVEPGGTLKFEHGSFHLMLMDLKKPIKLGESVDIVLETSMGDLLLEMPVIKVGKAHAHMKNSSDDAMDHDEHKDSVNGNHKEEMKHGEHKGMDHEESSEHNHEHNGSDTKDAQ